MERGCRRILALKDSELTLAAKLQWAVLEPLGAACWSNSMTRPCNLRRTLSAVCNAIKTEPNRSVVFLGETDRYVSESSD
jgi:hypothetical protein